MASVAQAYADTLAREHTDPPVHSNGEYGENLFWGTGTYSADNCVDMWGNEKSHYPPGTVIDASNFQIFGHYTQIVWMNTHELGGGKVSYDGLLRRDIGFDKVYLLLGCTITSIPYGAKG